MFCGACGRNLSAVEQLPTRAEWARERDGDQPSASGLIAAFLAAMHAAGDPGKVKMRRAEPGFLGRTQYLHGWVVRAVGDEPGLFLTADGRLHRLGSATQGIGYRGPVYRDVARDELADLSDAGPLRDDLAAVARANGLDDTKL